MNEGFGRTRPALQRGKATNDDSQPGVAGHRHQPHVPLSLLTLISIENRDFEVQDVNRERCCRGRSMTLLPTSQERRLYRVRPSLTTSRS